MKRREMTAALIAAAVVLLAVLVVFGIDVSNNQASSKRSLESRLHERAVLGGALIDSLFQSSAQSAQQAARAYEAPRVANVALERNLNRNLYMVLLSSSGRVLAFTRGFNAQARAELSDSATLRLLRSGRPWALGDVRPYGNTNVINFGLTLPSANRVRYLLTGFAPRVLGFFLGGELRQIPGVTGGHALLLDGGQQVLASTNPARPTGYVFRTSAQLQALAHRSGDVKGRYYDQVPLASSTWRILLSAPNATLFSSVEGWHHWLPWVILAAFALFALLSLALIRHGIRSSEQIREANSRLGEANAQLRHRARELIRSNAELEQFASIASHDLQEPLRKVRTFTQRVWEAESDALSERGISDLQRANASAERMQRLIDDLLRYSRVSTHGRAFTPVELDRVAAEVLEDLEETIRSADATVTVTTLPVLYADAHQMRQLLQNLISNGLKFAREDVAPIVAVTARVQNDSLTLTVADNGIGFEPQYRHRIFRVFERLHGRGSYPGTGIGLALCRKIAERHGGSIDADSVAGEGSTFTVTMPIREREPTHDAFIDPVGETDPTASEPYASV